MSKERGGISDMWVHSTYINVGRLGLYFIRHSIKNSLQNVRVVSLLQSITFNNGHYKASRDTKGVAKINP